MARLVERILIWLAVLVTAAAVVAVIINIVPSNIAGFHIPGLQSNRTVSSPIDDAEQAVSRGDTARALALAQRAVADNGGDATIANRAGNVALRAGDAKTAEKYYLMGETDDRRYPWNFVALGQLYERQGKQELADEQLRAASAAAPDQAFIHYDLGVVEMEEGLYAAALADFEAELKRSPTYRPAMVGCAEALEKLGRKGEAVALYQRAGVQAPTRTAKRPKLALKPVVQPSPSPSPSVALAVASPLPSPTRTARPKIVHHRVLATPQPVAVAQATPGPVRPPWATPPPSNPSSTVAVAPQTNTKLTEVSSDARNYLLDVGQDLGFTRALPSGEPSESTAVLRSDLTDALAKRPVDVSQLLYVGTSALLSGRIELASAAFNAAGDAAPHDWRGPYFAGLTAQAGGDSSQAQSYFRSSIVREPRAEAYTSLALVYLQNGDSSSAAGYARRAVEMTPSYEPGRFVAGMLDLIQSDLRGAEVNLTAAKDLGGAPARTAYFLTEVHDIVGASGVSGG
ncbi:MAG: tetratricopeptide repeat protein [Candidatus Eremiobacteraeota bacterium]|nr:tetratricopeptide repeat protein [Candidatus Eremiobacteraeota bacterium]